MLKKIIGTSIAMALLGAGLPALAAEGTIDGFPAAQNLDYTHIPGADQSINGTNAVLGGAYLFLSGSAFTPRTSTQTVTYPGGGCSFSSGYLNASLELPDGAEIQGIRLFYYSNDPTRKVNVILNTFAGNGGFVNLLDESSTQTANFTDEYFALPTPAVVDNSANSYVLVAATDTGTRLCGMRVFYTP